MSIPPGSGIGNSSEDYLSGLRDFGVPVSWTPMGWPSVRWQAPFGPTEDPDLDGAAHRDIAHLAAGHDAVVVHSVPVWHDSLVTRTNGNRLIAFTTNETDALCDDYVSILNRYDQVIVPSQFNVDVFASSGITVPVTAVPHIARPVQRDANAPRSIFAPTTFVFYLIATWTVRKAIPDAVEAFLTAFTDSDDVALVIHTTPRDFTVCAPITSVAAAPRPDESSPFALARILAGKTNAPKIVLNTLRANRDGIDWLHGIGHCFFSLSRGEGWGLGAFEAAAAGNPVIATGWSATPEFLPLNYPYLVDFELREAVEDGPDMFHRPQSGERWAVADRAHAAALLREVFDHRDEARSWGEASRVNLARNFNNQVVTRRLLDVIYQAG